ARTAAIHLGVLGFHRDAQLIASEASAANKAYTTLLLCAHVSNGSEADICAAGDVPIIPDGSPNAGRKRQFLFDVARGAIEKAQRHVGRLIQSISALPLSDGHSANDRDVALGSARRAPVRAENEAEPAMPSARCIPSQADASAPPALQTM